MELTIIIALIVGLVVASAFFLIKNKEFDTADRLASAIIGYLDKAIVNYGDNIKEYDEENGTTYYETLTKLLEDIHKMEQDDTISALDYALYVISVSEDIYAILTNTNLYDKVVTVSDKE